MRYPDGGGLTAAERACRERVRLEAAEMIEAGATDQEGGAAVPGAADVANRWRRALAAGGRDALATKGADGVKCRLSPAELDAGPTAWWWDGALPLGRSSGRTSAGTRGHPRLHSTGTPGTAR